MEVLFLLASQSLISAVNSYDNYIQRKGIDEQVIDAYIEACRVAINGEKDITYGLQITNRSKGIVERFCMERTGGTIWDLEKYSFANKTHYSLTDKLYDVLLLEAQNKVVDSAYRYLEKKREPRERFYMPRRKQFLKIGLMDAIQGMIDDIYDILCVSLIPGAGKAQPMYSKILTPNGFVYMKDLKIGTKVIAGNGEIANVIGVYPQGKRKIYEITLNDGSKCRCSDNHLWKTRTKYKNNCEIVIEFEYVRLYWYTFEMEIPCLENGKEIWKKIDSIEYIGKEECQCIMIDNPCHLYITDDYIITHNTTVEKMLNALVAGWFPRDFNLFYSHSGDITRMYYDGVYDICTNSDEYTWNEIFPNLSVTSTNAKMEQFNIGKYKPFPSVQCTSVGSKNAGKVRASKFLFVDDMIGGIEEAMNPIILDKLWDKYAVDARQRKTQDTDGKNCKEIHIATRWSVNDVIGRIQNMYEGNPRVKVIAVPDIDPKTGLSNFDYEFSGFTVAFFEDQQLLMDEISYRCLYKQEPIEREGLLFPEEKIRRYLNLPHGEPEIITGQCDTKGKGTDFFVLPVLQKYGEDYYCVDAVCDNTADYEMQYENAANVLVNNKVQECEFERNAGGDRVAMEVNKRVESKGWICNITDTPTETNKEARIFQCSNWILQHVIFKDPSLYKPNEPYGVMMSLLKRYSVSGKKQLDDVPDVFSNFALRITNGNRVAKVEAIQNPFSFGRRY
nr:MAG TPA: Terminase [Caudoviricetes sp.]